MNTHNGLSQQSALLVEPDISHVQPTETQNFDNKDVNKAKIIYLYENNEKARKIFNDALVKFDGILRYPPYKVLKGGAKKLNKKIEGD